MSTRIASMVAAVALAALVFLLMGAKDPHDGATMNHHVIDASLATGGHFVGDGLDQLAEGGLEVVIDLRPEDPAKRRARVTERGITYVHVPVSWEDPKPADFDRFRKALDAHRERNVLIQCAANYRASAMTYLYRTLVEAVPPEQARKDLDAVWRLNGTWREYVEEVIPTHTAP